jgi:hypothetical protein
VRSSSTTDRIAVAITKTDVAARYVFRPNAPLVLIVVRPYRVSLYSVFVSCLFPDESTFVSFEVVFVSFGSPNKSFFVFVFVSVTRFSSDIGVSSGAVLCNGGASLRVRSEMRGGPNGM